MLNIPVGHAGRGGFQSERDLANYAITRQSCCTYASLLCCVNAGPPWFLGRSRSDLNPPHVRMTRCPTHVALVRCQGARPVLGLCPAADRRELVVPF